VRAIRYLVRQETKLTVDRAYIAVPDELNKSMNYKSSAYGNQDKSGPISEMIGFLASKKLDTQHLPRAGRVST
jgi:hypothetical protein